jgi:general L-amino acid transport system permease protein
MHFQASMLLPARQPPAQNIGAIQWAKRNLWATPASAITTVLLVLTLLWTIPSLLEWSILRAVFAADADQCQAARDMGACWGVVTEKYRLILFGRYPFDAQWRPLLATFTLACLLVASCRPVFWNRYLVVAWILVWLLFFSLMGGGKWLGIPTGLVYVPTDQWGGLPLTMMLATLSITLAFPLAVLVALGRQSTMPAVRSMCIVYVELVRGVPLISVLFMASFMLPLLLPTGTSPDVLIRVLIGITLFSAAYTAEIVRGGLQAIPLGQIEAAYTIGLGYWQTQRQVVLPQALAHVVPSLMNSFIAIFKDTSLVTIVSLYELSGALGLAVSGDPNWRPFKIEAYLFITLIYFCICFAMSRYSLWVERQVSHR